MFERKDFEEIDREYFDVINETCYHIILKSKNTGHTWDIMCQERPNGRSLVISHKHKDKDPFHIQRGFHPKTVEDAQKKIMKHDLWHLKGRLLASLKGK